MSLDSKPELHQLQKLTSADGRRELKIIEGVAYKLEEVGLELKFELAVIKNIEHNYPRDVEGACRDLFAKWLAGEGQSGITWRTLIQAFKDSDLGEIAKVIGEIISSGVSESQSQAVGDLKPPTVPHSQLHTDQLTTMAAVAGAVISGATLGVDVLNKILQGMTGGRKIAIGVSNQSGTTWTAKEDQYLDFSTTSDVVPPEKVPTGKALLYSAKAVSGLPMAGITGAISYAMSDGNTLIFIFSVPFNYALYDNWWNVRVYKGHKKATESVFDELYSSRSKPIKGNDGWKEKDDIGQGYKAKGSMSSSGSAPLVINVMKQ